MKKNTIIILLIILAILILFFLFQKESSTENPPVPETLKSQTQKLTQKTTGDLDLLLENKQVSETISLDEFKRLKQAGGYTIIDVRTKEEWNGGVIDKNALFIDFYADNFKEELDKLNKSQKYLLYCKSGNRSAKTLKVMRELDFQHVKDLDGGITIWDKELEEK